MRIREEIQTVINNIKRGLATDVTLRAIDLETVEVNAIANALQQPQCRVTDLTIAQCNIGIAEAALIATALKSANCTVTNINLSWNNINSDGTEAIAEALKDRNCKVTTANLNCNPIGDDGLKALTQAGWDSTTSEVRRNTPSRALSHFTTFLNAHKTEVALCTAAVCALALCYKKPEMLTNLKHMFFRLFEKASSSVMSK